LTFAFASHEGLAVIGTAENDDSHHVPILGSSSSAMIVEVEEDQECQYLTTYIQGIKHYLNRDSTGIVFAKDFGNSGWKIDQDGSLKAEKYDQYLNIIQIKPDIRKSFIKKDIKGENVVFDQQNKFVVSCNSQSLTG
jgi:hypothetical protein